MAESAAVNMESFEAYLTEQDLPSLQSGQCYRFFTDPAGLIQQGGVFVCDYYLDNSELKN